MTRNVTQSRLSAPQPLVDCPSFRILNRCNDLAIPGIQLAGCHLWRRAVSASMACPETLDQMVELAERAQHRRAERRRVVLRKNSVQIRK